MHPSKTEFLSQIKVEIEFCVGKTQDLSFKDFQNDEALFWKIVSAIQ
jgi:hypothetical protein